MKTVVVYSSQHGRTEKVVVDSVPYLMPKPDVLSVKDASPEMLVGYDVMLFFAPTYGDAELHGGMENFLRSTDVNLSGRRFAICELGNYGGYDDFVFGALTVLRRRLLELGAAELGTHLSLDALPRLNPEHLHRWLAHVNDLVARHG